MRRENLYRLLIVAQGDAAMRKPRTKYVKVRVPGHPRTGAADGRVLEHLLVAEKALGKHLPPKAVVHHWDRDGENNEPANLVICENNVYHLLIHQRMRAFEACGNPAAHRCLLCSGYDRQEEMVPSSRLNPTYRQHASCRKAHFKKYNSRKHQPRVPKTHCKQGHALVEGNLVVSRRDAKVCRTCHNERTKRRRTAERRALGIPIRVKSTKIRKSRRLQASR